ncbi:DEAD/DEAH box helicase [Psychrobacter sp. ENNN9_III]|uniref:DEAD/DEAH box helicase n=1 Tax=Psychrobacter sp. ENNN9_III TaxID=1254334 RepID=UPI00071E79E9|nr:DEAD/DEAH box helicase [Psychrobacter sp. ENNN9_III]
MNITPLDLLSNFSKMDCYDYYDSETRLIIQDLEDKKVSIDYRTLILTQIDEILAEESDKKLSFVELLINKQSSSVLQNLINHLSIEILDNNEYQTVADYFKRNIGQLSQILGFHSNPEELTQNSKFDAVRRIEPKYPIREYQQSCTSDLWHLYDNEERRALLHLPTGAGKTRTAINFICEYLRENTQKSVIWFADTVELCEQARNEFNIAWESLGNRGMGSFAFYGSSSLSLSGISEGFIVAGLQKFRSQESSDKTNVKFILDTFKRDVGLIVFDEAHKALASTYKEIILDIIEKADTNCFLLGLSATPGRKTYANSEDDKENKQLSELFGNNKVTPNIHGYVSIIEYLIEKEFLSQYKILPINYDNSETVFRMHGDFENDNKLMSYLAESDLRNQEIINTVIAEINAPHPEIEQNPHALNQGIVFALNVNHAKRLEILLNNEGIKSKVIVGKTDSYQRSVAIQRYKNQEIRVLINYGVLTAGFDAPCTNSVFITRPTSSLIQYLQMAGRAMRGPKSGGSKNCRIYTVKDEDKQFNNMYNAFKYWDTSWKPKNKDH